MKRLHRSVIIIAALFMIVFLSAEVSSACTGIYVGSEASDDGTVIIARSSDHSNAVWGNYMQVVQHVDDLPGRSLQVDMEGTVFADIPDTTYQYTGTPFFSSTMYANNVPNDAGACTNECGVAMTMAITAFPNEHALEADPLVTTGLTENTAADLVLCQSATAREAVGVLLGIIDKYGSSEGNIALIADQKEAWCVEMYTGHQYAAVKLPADKVSVFGNEYNIKYLSKYEECIKSDGLESLPEEKGFAVYGKNGELDLYETYSGSSVTTDYCHMRTWIGHKVLAPSKYDKDYDRDKYYPLCFKADKRVSISDVVTLLRNRYEGTKYDPDKTGRIDMRVIGTDTAMSVHALQVYKGLPAEISCVTWECTGPAIYGLFVPLSNAAVTLSASYGADQPEEDYGVFDSWTYPYYAMKEITTMCVGHDDYKIYGTPVKEYWKNAEDKMFSVMPEILRHAAEMDSEKGAEYITSYCNSVQDQALTDAKQLINDIVWAKSYNSNTLKLGRNPETGEFLKKERVLQPMEVNLDASVYGDLPSEEDAESEDSEEGEKTEGGNAGTAVPVLIALAVLVVFLIIIGTMRKNK